MSYKCCESTLKGLNFAHVEEFFAGVVVAPLGLDGLDDDARNGGAPLPLESI
jgi:hypothetical protein